MNSALALIPGAHGMLEVDGAGHDLLGKKTASELPSRVAKEFEVILKALSKNTKSDNAPTEKTG